MTTINKNITVNQAQSVAPNAVISIKPCGVGEMTEVKMVNGFKATVNSDGQVATWKNGNIENVIDHHGQCNGIIETTSVDEQAEVISKMNDMATGQTWESAGVSRISVTEDVGADQMVITFK